MRCTVSIVAEALPAITILAHIAPIVAPRTNDTRGGTPAPHGQNIRSRRIIAVADVYDAMTIGHPTGACSHDDRRRLVRAAGTARSRRGARLLEWCQRRCPDRRTPPSSSWR